MIKIDPLTLLMLSWLVRTYPSRMEAYVAAVIRNLHLRQAPGQVVESPSRRTHHARKVDNVTSPRRGRAGDSFIILNMQGTHGMRGVRGAWTLSGIHGI